MPASIGQGRQVDDRIGGRQQIRYFLGPFDEATVSGFEVFVHSDGEGFSLVFQSVGIDVEDGVTLIGTVFIDEGKRRAAGGIDDAHGFTHRINERGFTGAHLTIEDDDGMRGGCKYVGGDAVDFFEKEKALHDLISG